MGPPEILKRHGILTNEAGFLCVDSKTLRHTRYQNIYGIGDCTTTPNSKTMAAIGKNLKNTKIMLMNNIVLMKIFNPVSQLPRQKFCTTT